MKKNTLAILVVVVIVVIGIVVLRKSTIDKRNTLMPGELSQSSEKVVNEANAPVQGIKTGAPTESTHVTKNGWKVLTNETYGFAVDYPEAWQLDEPLWADSSKSLQYTFWAPKGERDESFYSYHLDVIVQPNSEKLSSQEFAEKIIANNNKIGYPYSYKKSFPLKVGDQNGYEVYGLIKENREWEVIYVAHADNIYWFIFPTAPVKGGNPDLADYPSHVADNATVHEMLNTFRFKK